MQRVTSLVNQLSFSRKLAFTFFICSLLTFVVIDIIMNVLYSTVVTSTNTDSTFNTQAFSQFSNSEILSSTESYLNSGVDIYEEIATVIYVVYQHFKPNPSIYTSKQKKGTKPELASTFNTPRYDRSCMYFYTPNSTFYNEPFMDKIIASSATSHFPNRLQRINIIYQSKTDPTDISVRTMPATKDFYIPNVTVVSERMNGLSFGVIQASDIYNDVFSKTQNTTKLIALRVLVKTQYNINMLIEVEVKSDLLNLALTRIISYPSTKVVLLKIINGTSYNILGQSSELPASINLTQYLKQGSNNVTISGYEFLVTNKKIIDENNDIHINFGQNDSNALQMENHLIIFLNKTEAELPNTVYQSFTSNEYSVLIYILYGWSVIVMLVVFSIGFVIGDIIFEYFSLICKKSKQYLHNPASLKEIDAEIKQKFRHQTSNRLLFENIVGIMQGIENKKKQNRKNFKINYDTYPLNRFGINFQSQMRIRDYHKFEQIASIIKDRSKYLK